MFQKGLFKPKELNLEGRRTMMQECEPQITVTNIVGNGENAITVDLGIVDPTIVILYATPPLINKTYPTGTSPYKRMLLLIDKNVSENRILYCNNRNSSTLGYLSSSTSNLIGYQNKILTVGVDPILISNYEYKVIAIKSDSNLSDKYSVTDIVGNGQTTINVDLKIDNPSIIVCYAKTPLSSGNFPNQDNGERLFALSDNLLSNTHHYYINTASSTARGNYLYSSINPIIGYSNGELSISVTSTIIFRNNYPYRIIAIK